MISLRTAVPADVDALVPFVNGGYRGESSKKGWTTEDDPRFGLPKVRGLTFVELAKPL